MAKESEVKPSSTESEQSTNSVSRAEFESLLERVNSQSGILGKISKSLEKLTTTETPKPQQQSPEEQGIEARLKRLEEQKAQLDQREQTTRARIIRNNVSRALTDAGVPNSSVDIIADGLLSRERDRFVLDDASETVSVKSGEEQINLSRWAGLFLMSDAGKGFLGGNRNPRIPIPKPGDTSTPAITPEQVVSNTALRQEFKQTDPEGYQKMMDERLSPRAVIERAKKAHAGS